MAHQSPSFYDSIRLPFFFIGVLWFIHLLQVVNGWDLGYLGIYPRHFFGLRGVITAPFIHGDIAHLISNSVPLFVLWSLIRYFYPKVATRSFLMIFIMTGLVVWGLGRSVFHIGASGVIYGLVAFLLGNGIFRRNVKSTILALIILFFYSGMFVGILPDQQGISWESHLIGALVGLFVAYFYKEEIEADEERQLPSWELEEEAAQPYFLPRDIFDQTIEERRRAEEDAADGWTSSTTWEED